MRECTDPLNPHERVVMVTETIDGQDRTFYAIRDRHLGYWRGYGALDEYNAWTRDLGHRAEFASPAEARAELRAILAHRRLAA